MALSTYQVRHDLNQIFNLWSSDVQRITKCRILITNVISIWSANMIEILKVIVEFLAKNNVTLFVSRQIFSDLCMKILPWLPNPQSKLLAHFMQEKMKSREVDFEYHISVICHHLSYIYEGEENWKEAAYMLANIPMESYYRFSVDYELELYMKIARLYMESNEPLLAGPFVKKASMTQTLTLNRDLHLNFKICVARMMDFRLKFIDAAQQYYELSHYPSLSENERMTAVKNTIVCTILSLTDNIRTQLLKSLFKDERCKVYIKLSILEKLCVERMIKPREIEQIEKMLLPHQRVNTNYGTTILIEAIAEHNINSIKKLYKCIKIESLGHLLELEPEIVKIVAGKMISGGRIKGSIDHTNGFVKFKMCRIPNESKQFQQKKIESLNIHLNRMKKLIPVNESEQNVRSGHTHTNT
ncbi:COP9 signalosome complex subunit 4-like [Melanaphis sacchari]|uniref:COP9 signalosome complex subunit 4-like n=1 Tax=Melanaphis sacchari TaxID=742174 RepID=UPI000DC151C6|nr:COP9 signalosome complex subunit 4-like [Melanaphis sacchari]